MPVNMTSDGLALSPADYAGLLSRLAQSGALRADSYGAGGSVDDLECEMAAALGKPAAVVMPTGTMANLLAVQHLAGSEPKVIVQRESHLFNDCGDCAPGLAGLHLIPLGAGATFSAAQARAAMARADAGKVEAPVGVISVETPVRRLDGEMFDPEALAEVQALARARGVRLHLDGARLPVVAAVTGRSMAEIAAPFDTVYVSLYKCFNSLSGGLLAGDEALIHRLRHWRRRNGGGMAQMWPMAAVARHYLADAVSGLEEAFGIAEAFFGRLEGDARFNHVPVPHGSSVSHVALTEGDRRRAEAFRAHLGATGVHLPPPDGDPSRFAVKVNASWRRSSATRLHAAFADAADAVG